MYEGGSEVTFSLTGKATGNGYISFGDGRRVVTENLIDEFGTNVTVKKPQFEPKIGFFYVDDQCYETWLAVTYNGNPGLKNLHTGQIASVRYWNISYTFKPKVGSITGAHISINV